jgi:tetratricopeptide (TPR) repeat protein
MSRLQLKVALAQKAKREFLTIDESENDYQQELNNLLDLQIERHRQGVSENPNHADMHYRYGILLRGRGRTDEAIKHFRSALAINPSYIKARIKLGLALREQGQLDEGIEHLREALRIKPEYADLHYRLGLMYCDKMQFALAVEHFDIALKNNPDNVNVHANLALSLQNMGLIDRAHASWRAVCELEPQSPLAFQAQRELMTIRPVK